jgi:hypothetical protein
MVAQVMACDGSESDDAGFISTALRPDNRDSTSGKDNTRTQCHT